MSLFGSSPPGEHNQSTRSAKSQSLFDDEQANGTTNASIFDDGDGDEASPWNMPTPKKAGRSNTVKTLLSATSIPESYVDAFDTILESGFRVGSASISLSGARKIFEGSGLDAGEQTKIINLVTGGQDPVDGLGRNEFNVLVALAGLAQEHEEVTLDGVDERRKSELEAVFSGKHCARAYNLQIFPSLRFRA